MFKAIERNFISGSGESSVHLMRNLHWFCSTASLDEDKTHINKHTNKHSYANFLRNKHKDIENHTDTIKARKHTHKLIHIQTGI